MESTSRNRVILGLMTFGPPSCDESRITTLDAFDQVLDTLKSRGYNELDTARVYIDGGQEAWTRQAKWKDRGFKLATKVVYPHRSGDNSAEKVLRSVESSLTELGTDCLDILYLHAPDRTTPFEETLRAINDLHKANKFRQLGLSNFTAFEVAEIVLTCAARGWVRPSIYQAMYNALTRGIEAELIPACQRYGLDIVVYNPLCAGLLAGKIKAQDGVVATPAEGRFAASTKIGARYRDRYFCNSTFAALAVVEQAATHHGLSVHEVALRWMVHHSALDMASGKDGIIIGVSTPAQVVSNLDCLEKGPLPEDVVAALNEAWQITKAEAPPYWHQGKPVYAYDTIKELFP